MVTSALAACALAAGPALPLHLATGPVLGIHLAIAAALAIGATFRDDLARFLQATGLVALTLASLQALLMVSTAASPLDRAILQSYPLFSATVAITYGLWLKHRPALASAAFSFAVWFSVVGGQGYSKLRPSIPGLDQIALGLAFFAVAALVSLAKSGVLSRWLLALREWASQPPADPHNEI